MARCHGGSVPVCQKSMSVNKCKIGLTFGAFDLFHMGHLNLLKNIKRRCETLIVCVSTDEYIEKHKGKKPIFPFEDRLRIVMAIKYVDDIDEQGLDFGKKEAIERYSPDVLFVGDDWHKETYTGEGLGIPVVYLSYTSDISSTIIAKKLAEIV